MIEHLASAMTQHKMFTLFSLSNCFYLVKSLLFHEDFYIPPPAHNDFPLQEALYICSQNYAIPLYYSDMVSCLLFIPTHWNSRVLGVQGPIRRQFMLIRWEETQETHELPSFWSIFSRMFTEQMERVSPGSVFQNKGQVCLLCRIIKVMSPSGAKDRHAHFPLGNIWVASVQVSSSGPLCITLWKWAQEQVEMLILWWLPLLWLTNCPSSLTLESCVLCQHLWTYGTLTYYQASRIQFQILHGSQ